MARTANTEQLPLSCGFIKHRQCQIRTVFQVLDMVDQDSPPVSVPLLAKLTLPLIQPQDLLPQLLPLRPIIKTG